MSDKTYVGRRLSEFESSPAFEPVTRVVLWYDDENSYSAGDDGGRTLELHCPWATQAMADNVLAAVAGYVYRPFSGGGAMLDPAAEVGDAVTVNGVYSLLASVDTTFDALCLSDISAPAEQEVDHEYPYQSPQGRELKRKVSLEQKYYGTKISRREGLVIEKTDGDAVEARVVLNADKLAFYDGAGQEQLYFDPAAGCYKFRGALNVNDNFIVDKLGNVTMKGGINLSDGSITWGGQGPVKYQFSTDGTNWHDTMQTNDKYRRDSLDGGTTWGNAYQFKGQDGQNGRPGSDADVTRANIVKAMMDAIAEDGLYTANVNGKQCLGINATAIITGALKAIDIEGCTYFSKNRVGELTLSDREGMYSDLSFRNENGYELFSITDGLADSGTLYLVGKPIVYVNAGRPVLAPEVEVHATFA